MNKETWSAYFRNLWANIRGNVLDDEGGGFFRREKVIVFMFSFGIALILWFLVNLSRPFNLTITLPVDLESVPPGKALAEDVPHQVTVNVNGEGWKLLRIYSNPPRIKLHPVAGTMNFYDDVRGQLNMFAGIEVAKVMPATIDIKLEKKITKKIPVVANVLVKTDAQYEMVGWPVIIPDSVEISGAPSVLAKINNWPTAYKEIKGADSDINAQLSLIRPDQIITLAPRQVVYRAKIREYTGDEVSISIQTDDLPDGQGVSYSPPTLLIHFGIPIDEYESAQKTDIFRAYVPYGDILKDTTGFVAPLIAIETDSLHVRIRSYQPHRVRYFTTKRK